MSDNEKIKLLEENRKKLSEELRALMESLDKLEFPLWLRDSDLEIKFFNGKASSIIDQFDEETRSLNNKSIEKHIVIDGERKLFRVTESSLDDGGTIGYAIDITEIEEVKSELKQHTKSQETLLGSLSNAVAIYGSDTRLRFCNKAFADLWKLDENFLSEKPEYSETLERLREKRKLPEQINFPAFKKDSVALFTSLIEKHEEFYYLPDGTVIKIIIIPHEEGGLLFSYYDITEQIALERSYNTLISVNKSTVDNLHEGVAVFGEDGRLQLYNPAYVTLWEVSESFLKSEPHISDIIDETKELYYFENDWENYKSSVISNALSRELFENVMFRTDGSTLKWSSTPLPNGSNLLTFIDITDSIKVEQSLRAEKEALAEADRIKTGFLANVSYELRSPLTSIMGFSEMLLEKIPGEINEKQGEYLSYIKESSNKLASMIDNIIDVASIDAGHMKLEVSEFTVSELLSVIKDSTHFSQETSQIKLDTQFAQDIAQIKGDKKRITYIITNMVNNSADLINGGDTIYIRIESADNGNINIIVDNNGEPLPEGQEANMFGQFFEAGSNENISSGLGLTTSKSFAELHGGSLSVEPSKNSSIRFILELPGK